MANRFNNPLPVFFETDGDPLAGGKLYAYLTGTTTPTNTYSNTTLTTPNSNPIILSSAGRLPNDVFLSSSVTYKFVLKTSDDVEIWTADPVVDPAANVTAAFQVYAGNPNGNVAGNAGTVGGVGASVIWDITNFLLYVCTTTGSASTAVWTQVGSTLSGLIQITGVSTPASLSTSQNDYAPSGSTTATVIRQNASANVAITGFGGGTAGAWRMFVNISNDSLLTFNDEADSTASTAANRLLNGGRSITLAPGESASWRYDISSSRWRLWATNCKTLKPSTLTDAGTIAWDLAIGGPDYEVTITASRTLGAFTNGVKGQKGQIRIIEDGTGDWTLAFNAVYKFASQGTDIIARGAGDVTIFEYYVDATNSMRLWRVWSEKAAPGLLHLDTQVASASGTLDFVLARWDGGYSSYVFLIENLIPATDDVELWMRTSTDGGSTYASIDGSYAYAATTQIVPGGSTTALISVAAAASSHQIELAGLAAATSSVGNGAAEGVSGRVTLYTPNNAATRTRLDWTMTWIPADGTIFVASADGHGIRDATADVDGVRFLFESGNIASGRIKMFGYRQS